MTVNSRYNLKEKDFEDVKTTSLWYIEKVIVPQIKSREQDLSVLKKVMFDTGEINEAMLKLKSQIKFLKIQRKIVIASNGLTEGK